MTEQHSSPEDRYAHLRANAAAQKRTTVDRLSQAIATLEAEGRAVNTFTIKEVSGLDYMAYYRNAEALTLFRTHSTHLHKKRKKELVKQRSRRKQSRKEEADDEVQAVPRDRFLNYKKPELVVKLRAAQAEQEQMEQRYHALLQEHMQCGLTITRLEAQLAEHLAFMNRFRSSLKQEEHGSQP